MIKKLILILLIIGCLSVASLFFIGKHLAHKGFQQPLSIPTPTYFTVDKGTSVQKIIEQLVTNQWIDNSFWVKVYIRLYPELANIKAGTYQIRNNSTVSSFVQQLVSGEEHQFHITFIEGSTFKEWLLQLADAPYIQRTLNDKTVAEVAKSLSIEHQNPEGLFFPDTYAYTANMSDKQILLRAYRKMSDVLATQWQIKHENLPYRSAYEALIMASIIEKESGVHAEQPLIASVFMNRLHKKMRLQTDPTVIYGLGERYKGDIKYSHLREKTPYNTYRINGLTPTPIAMPGIKAITAALQPAKSDYFYFVSNGNGQHVFSKTLAEHNKAVQQYLASFKK